MLYGIPPFYSNSVNNMYRKIIKEKVVFKSSVKTSDSAKDFINMLLRKNPRKRLGSQADSLEVLSHPFFKDFDWSKLLSKEIKPPFKPKVDGDDWIANFDDEFTKEKAKDSVAKVNLDDLKQF